MIDQVLKEIGIEGGLLAYLLLGVFVAWFVVNSVRIWRRHASAPGVLTGRLASMIVFLAIAASATDYPMRTALIGTIFVAACVILHRVSGETASSAAPARSKQR